MDRNFLKKACLSVGILLFLAAMSANPATAGRVVRPYHPVNLLITAVFVDFENGTITIKGYHFERGYDPIVHLGDTSLRVQSFSNREIVTNLPDEIVDGDYLLTVVTGPSSNHYDSYALTVMSTSGGGVAPLQASHRTCGPSGTTGTTGTNGSGRTSGGARACGFGRSDGSDRASGAAGACGSAGP